MKTFNIKKLAKMTAILVILGLSAYSDADHGSFILMAGLLPHLVLSSDKKY